MFKIILLIATTAATFMGEELCAYWCESSCKIKVASFYCCSYNTSLTGPTEFLPPPCPNLCSNRTGNALARERNCKTEIDQLTAAGTFKICRNFKDCDPNTHDLCCPDNCLSGKQKMCII